MDAAKRDVQQFWDRAACGEDLFLEGRQREHYDEQAKTRYALEPYIPGFAGFEATHGKRVLEIGVGLGADHEQFALAGADLAGIDLTPRAVAHTASRIAHRQLPSALCVADAERLPFPGESSTASIRGVSSITRRTRPKRWRRSIVCSN